MFLLAFLALGLVPLIGAIATCYRQDNHNATNPMYTPCNTDRPFSMCYRSQVDAYNSPPDRECLPNGVTYTINSGGNAEYWRQSCTDRTWTSPYCLNAFNACLTDVNGNAQVSPCGDATSSTWCCGANNTACCGTSGAITIAAALGSDSQSSSTTSSSSSSSSSTVTLASTSTTPTSPAQSAVTGLATPAKAGIGAGAGFALLAGVAFIGWMTLRKRKPKFPGVDKAEISGSEVFPAGELSAGQYYAELSAGKRLGTVHHELHEGYQERNER